MSDQRAINVIFAQNICELYGTDASQFDIGTLALVIDEGVYFSLLDSGGTPTADLVSTTNGPAQPGCSNPNVNIGTSDLRWARTTMTIVDAGRGNAPAYYVNETTGDDSLDGLTPPTAVQHIAEISRRMKGADYNSNTIEIFCLTDIAPDDVPFFERSLTPGFPIIIHSTLGAPAPYKPAPTAAITLTSVANLDPADNQDQLIGGTALGAQAGNMLVLSDASTNPGAFAWARFAPTGTTLVTTPFGTIAAPSPNITLADPDVADVVDVFPLSTFPVGSLRMDVDAGAEIWLQGFTIIEGTGATPQKIVSGGLRLVQCTGSDPDHSTINCYGDASLFFDGSSPAFIQSTVHGNGVAEMQTSVVSSEGLAPVAKTRRFYNHCCVSDGGAIFCGPQEPAGVECSYTEIEDLSVTGFSGNGGAVACDHGPNVLMSGFLYGLNVIGYVASFDHWTQATYDAVLVPAGGATFVATQDATDINKGSARVNFPRSVGPTVDKSLSSVDLPFVSVATAVDSQAGFLATA